MKRKNMENEKTKEEKYKTKRHEKNKKETVCKEEKQINTTKKGEKGRREKIKGQTKKKHQETDIRFKRKRRRETALAESVTAISPGSDGPRRDASNPQ